MIIIISGESTPVPKWLWVTVLALEAVVVGWFALSVFGYVKFYW